MVFDTQSISARIVEVALDSSGRPSGERSLTRGLGHDRQPAYSPDGRQVIFSSNRTGNIDLWLLDRTSGVLRQLTDDPADDWDPAFTPDGERLIWSSNRSGNMEIWLAAADGSGARQITRDGVDAENPTMTADGEWIVYYSSNDANLGIWKIRPDGSDATRLVEGSVLLPEVSPDGRYALYVLFYSLRSAIQVVDVTSGELLPFEIEQGSAERHQNVVFGRARWTPDGQAIVYVGQGDQGRIGIFRQDFVPGEDTSATRTPLTGFTRDSITESLGISPDGRAVAVSVMQDQRTLRLAEHVPLTAWR
jgi:Tol biopolymer transport system component